MAIEQKGYDFVKGEVLLFNKPLYWTSFQLVKKIRYIISSKLKIKKIKVGHAGTLDPLATGLMIICTGGATKTINTFLNQDKEYIAKIKFGETTPSFDLETDVDKNFSFSHITTGKLIKTLSSLHGEQLQKPPIYSAKFVNGKRAYDYAREGKNVTLKAVPITIKELDLLDYNAPIAEIRIKCSKGTYIRAFARDLGIKLNSGAHLIALQRTAIGDHTIKNALSIAKFEENIEEF